MKACAYCCEGVQTNLFYCHVGFNLYRLCLSHYDLNLYMYVSWKGKKAELKQ